MAKPKGSPKTGGRKAGTPNKTTKALKDAILEAAEIAGGEGDDRTPGGLVGYLVSLALGNQNAFGSLLGKVLPLQVTGDGKTSGAVVITWDRDAKAFDPSRDVGR